MNTIYSKQYNDIYFSEDDGLAESLYTFIEANNIKERIIQDKKIIVAELGFGTGLNFLALWDYLQKIDTNATLEYWTIEKYPLSKEEISDALSQWHQLKKILPSFLEKYSTVPFLEQYQDKNKASAPLIYSFNSNNIKLNLLIGDIDTGIDQFPNEIDCWFLDGFAPDKNPEMWSVKLFKKCFEKSARGATASTFTSAGIVKRNLREAGFFVKRLKGFGKKRHMVKAFKTPPLEED